MNKSSRSFAINTIALMRPEPVASEKPACFDHYGIDVFNTDQIQQFLPKAVAEKLLDTIRNGAKVDPEIAGDVAHGMKEWALAHGATHFTHWFMPLTGTTAEKHDAFLEPDGDRAILSFSGKNLIVSEPDASSFPSGGLRSTFEARGYTAWDPTSPAFIKRHANGATLCIPTAFCSYTGEALDRKTPLLRSMQSLRCAIKRLMKCFRQPDAPVTITLGAEQEYFLIDKTFYLSRPDLLQTGRTLFGATPPKHQQLDDHYFGAIKPRVLAFMTEVEHQLWRLGIPAKTRHNETAPAQFELAPAFEGMNLASDHNMLVMEVLRQVADRYGLVCLLHEKPFAGINGSGKHNNWSVMYGDVNLLNPGSDPRQNAIFLTVLCAIIKAVDEHGDLLRCSVSGAGNDHRLGANEAPPGIMSIFLGDQLTEVIEQILKGGAASSRRATAMRIGVDTLPPLPRDVTDRNRTSPFAFTGNKFEFRAPGASQACAAPMMMLNTIIAEALDELAAELERLTPETFNDGLQKLLRETISKHQRIIFNGDNYSAEWRAEAARRGLPNAADTMSSLKALLRPENIELLSRRGVLGKKELESRYEVFLEEYHRKIRIEGEIGLEMARSMILPAAIDEYRDAARALQAGQASGLSAGCAGLTAAAEAIGNSIDELVAASSVLQQSLLGEHEGIIAALLALRIVVDRLEKLVADDRWPLPKYREMLFIY